MTVESRFCPRCGTRLSSRPPTTCGSCGYALFVNARPTATVIVRQGPSYLAVLRAIQPKKGRWELPGGFCDGFEHPADAAIREAREELGLTIRLGEFVGMYLGTYEFQEEMLPVLDCFWLASIADGELVLQASEVCDYAWLAFDDPPELAFDTMNRAVIDARKLV